jgi:hypothetical protein
MRFYSHACIDIHCDDVHDIVVVFRVMISTQELPVDKAHAIAILPSQLQVFFKFNGLFIGGVGLGMNSV